MGNKDLFADTTRFKLYGLHKSFGVTVLILVTLRIIWHIKSRRPKAVDTLPRRDQIAAAIMHYFLYALMIAMPLSGWLMSSAYGRSVSFFGLFTLPDLIGKDVEVGKILSSRHALIGYIIMGAVALHAGAALWHHFIKKDIVLKRMLPLLAAAALLVPATCFAEAIKWTVSHTKSSITFRPKQMGQEFNGTFGTFSADIAFDPENLAESKAVVTIQLATAHTGAADRDENLKSPDWFDIVQFPEAQFETTAIKKTGEGAYVADGTLTIKGVQQPVSLPFTLTIGKNESGLREAVMDGTVVLERLAFNVGIGQWAEVSIIANEVPVDVRLVAVTR
jgi:cytochrome b561/polyisoprenoid-binding protein YceI